jgi:hypothetical protein
MSPLPGTHVRCGTGEGYEDGDGCATFAFLSAASDGDLSTSSFDKLLSHPKPYATPQISLGGEEWFKNPCQMLLQNSRPVILHNYLKPIS